MSKKTRQRRLRRLEEPRGVDLAVQAGMTKSEIGMVLAIGLAFCLAVAVELGGTTPEGTLQLTHWTPWRDLGILQTSAILFGPFPLIAWVLWRSEKDSPLSPSPLVALLVFASLALQALSMLADPRGLHLVQQIAASPGATSYFSDAVRIRSLAEWLQHFHEIPLGYHSVTHPPGPIVFYFVFFKLFGPSAGATLGGWAIGLLGSAGVAVMYAFAGLWTIDRRAQLTASAFYALIPALTLFFPEFDQVYPVLSMLLVFFWVKAVGASAVKPALGAGVVLFLATFFAYNLLALGVFLAYYGLHWLWRAQNTRPAWRSLFRTSGMVLGVYAGLYAVLRVATGYNPFAALHRAVATQAVFAANLHRAYGPFVLLDLYDFFLGAGILAFPILLFHLRRQFRQWNVRRHDLALTLIGLATILTLDLSGLLRGETARVWLFLQPLLIVPVALELARVPWRWKLSIFALQWWILACLKAKMTFLNP
jgi:hypothetical protein